MTLEKEKRNFIDGQFTPSEASEMLVNMFDGAIRFCSIQQMSEWERNHNADTSYYERKKSELCSSKTAIKEYMNQLKLEQQKLKIEVVLNIQPAE